MDAQLITKKIFLCGDVTYASQREAYIFVGNKTCYERRACLVITQLNNEQKR